MYLHFTTTRKPRNRKTTLKLLLSLFNNNNNNNSFTSKDEMGLYCMYPVQSCVSCLFDRLICHNFSFKFVFLFQSFLVLPVYYTRAAVLHLNFRAGSTFPVPVCTRSTRSDFRLNLLLLKGQRCLCSAFLF